MVLNSLLARCQILVHCVHHGAEQRKTLVIAGHYGTHAGDVASLQVQQTVLDFVRSKLQDSSLSIDAAIVFGGPTCTLYSAMARENQRYPFRFASYQAETEHYARMHRLAAARRTVYELHNITHGSVSRQDPVMVTAAVAEQQSAVAAFEQALQNRQHCDEQARMELHDVEDKLMAADALVSSFITMYKGVQAECQVGMQASNFELCLRA